MVQSPWFEDGSGFGRHRHLQAGWKRAHCGALGRAAARARAVREP